MQKIDIKLKPSKIYVTLAALVLMGCVIIIYTLSLPRWARGILMAIVIRYGWVSLKNDGLLLGGDAIQRLSLSGDAWHLHDRLRTSIGSLCGDSTVTTLICILRFKIAETGKKRSCVIFRDSLPAEDYKRLIAAVRTAT